MSFTLYLISNKRGHERKIMDLKDIDLEQLTKQYEDIGDKIETVEE